MIKKEQLKINNKAFYNANRYSMEVEWKGTKIEEFEWSGCNFIVNTDGSAQAARSCDGCVYYDYCDMQQSTPLWSNTKAKEKELRAKNEKLRQEIEG